MMLVAGLLCAVLTVNATGPCGAKFSVIESSLDPAARAKIKVLDAPGTHVRPRIATRQTEADGTASFEGLSPKKTPRLLFGVSLGNRSTTVLVDLSRECHGTYRVVLPDKVPPER